MSPVKLELETVRLELSRGVARLVLDRPHALNAWTRKLGEELTLALDRAAEDSAVRAIVLTGAGRAFSAGADLKSGREFRSDGKPDALTLLREVYNPLLLRVRTIPKPTIAAVNGPAVGIGCSLALASDLILAAESAYFQLAFVNVGLGLDGGASATLSARVGQARAFQMAYLGEQVPAAQALEWGLINHVLPADELDNAAQGLANKLAAGSPGSYANIKRTINNVAYPRFEEQLDLEAELQQERAESEDYATAVRGFAAKH
jgi:2-(1,2-epoxy-1,2-dihydrophenyl)acetyl-CoA isomerase